MSPRVIAATSRGAGHERSGTPNQDAFAIESTTDGSCTVVAIADGHGSPRTVRTHVGSRLAAQVAVAAGFELADRPRSPDVGAVVVREWQRAVDDDLLASPLSSAEEARLRGSGSGTGEVDPRHAYGATLLVAVVTEAAIVLLQLGDGDALAVAADGSTSRPVPADPRLFANQTTSLSGGDPGDVRMAELERGADGPALVVLSTDGYVNSFASDDDFLAVGADLLRLVREQGADHVEAALPGWAAESADTSGDDTTVAVIVLAV